MFLRKAELTVDDAETLSGSELNAALARESQQLTRVGATFEMIISGALAEQQQAQDFGFRSVAAAV